MLDVLIDCLEFDGLGVYEFGWYDEDVVGVVVK